MKTKSLITRALLPVLTAGVLTLAAGSASAASACIDYSTFGVSTSYAVGGFAATGTSTILYQPFEWSSGTTTYAGTATIVASNYANGTAPEVNLNNINTYVFPNSAADSAKFLYADLGGNVNFVVNGDFYNTDDLMDLDGTVIGGCQISVSEVSFFGGVYGAVEIIPTSGTSINFFGFGGQEFFADDVCYEY
ncbi:hypothetical protein G6O69_00855 [Pseudenhygromyxa sp. WMMC2535]|uniref:hypothetical protein n=1 Tax=Pseudenhygromyxa sp. WMMC2535 TaxID=2712867 RepID=UPI001557D4D0|nr:hypothetical protein [Pseudenhygromyxa sp. WMMC2535]NVB36359.1 hypothetical protein [Pseudenhygromyxa sp. WMMC2535]